MSAHHLNEPSKLPRGHISGRRARFRLWSLTFIILVTTTCIHAVDDVEVEDCACDERLPLSRLMWPATS